MIGNMLYVTIEGIDGCGKTTLATRLIDALKEKGFRVGYFSMLPHNKIREVVLWDETLSPLQRATLYKVGAETTRSEMIKHSDEFDISIVERGVDTYVAYQGYGDGLLTEIKTLLKMYPAFPYPDRTYYLDISVELSFSRTHTRGEALDHFESKERSFFERVRKGFKHRMESEQDHAEEHHRDSRFKHVDGSLDKDTIFDHVLSDLLSLLEKKADAR